MVQRPLLGGAEDRNNLLVDGAKPVGGSGPSSEGPRIATKDLLMGMITVVGSGPSSEGPRIATARATHFAHE